MGCIWLEDGWAWNVVALSIGIMRPGLVVPVLRLRSGASVVRRWERADWWERGCGAQHVRV